MSTLVTKKAKEEKLHRLMLKKIRIEIGQGKVILQVSEKHKQIAEMLAPANLLKTVLELSDLELKKKSHSYVIADLDSPELDDFEGFLDIIAPTIIRPGLLMIVGTNMSTLKNKIALFMNKLPEASTRPIRSVPTDYVRDMLLRKGFFVKNRFWFYDDKFLIMADIPKNV